MFKRKPKHVHTWKVLGGNYELEGDNNPYWERFTSVTFIKGYCTTCGETSQWKIANWKMTEAEFQQYVRDVYPDSVA